MKKKYDESEIISLGDLITVIELSMKLGALNSESLLAIGFDNPHSYRGIYAEIAFEPAENVKLSKMLALAKGAIGQTFTGYKGGEFVMGHATPVRIANYGECDDETDALTLDRLQKMLKSAYESQY